MNWTFGTFDRWYRSPDARNPSVFERAAWAGVKFSFMMTGFSAIVRSVADPDHPIPALKWAIVLFIGGTAIFLFDAFIRRSRPPN
jgi:hypothetical protein